MQCPRCRGLMVNEQIYTDQGGLDIARCIHCGDIIDSVVIYNRIHTNFEYKKVFRGCNTVTTIG